MGDWYKNLNARRYHSDMTGRIALPLALLTLVAGAAAWIVFGSETNGPETLRRPAEAEAAEPDPGDRRGALVDQIVFTQETDLGKVTALVEGGKRDVFASGITNPTVFRRLRDSERAAYDLSYGTTTELALNPAGPRFEDGRLNPFHVPEIREALNWLVDRRHIAEELYGGLAVPRFLPLNTAFPDYARLADVARALEIRYEHDPEHARRVISEQMEKLGARLEDGRWVHDGSRVRLVVLIRTEDERKLVGDYFANLLEDVGFTVERQYRTAEEASRIWIAGDPRAGEWHVYTGGWISTMINRDLAGNLSSYYTPRGRPEPLWQVYDPDPELDAIAERLERRDYETWEERQQLMARGMELAMRDSVRIWLVDQLSVWPRARNVSLAVDLAGGISGSALWPYTIRFRDRIGGNMTIALPGILTEPWNPVAGSNWIFDRMVTRALEDADLIPDPYTGLYWPQRIKAAEVTVQEDVPVIRTLDWLTVKTAGEIRVPEDAWIDWDAGEGRFVTVGEKHPDGITTRAVARVRYEDDYFERRWHDGSRISLADLILPWILAFDRADEKSRLFDRSYVPTFDVFRRHFRGWRIVSRDPLEVEIYGDQIFPDAEWIVGSRIPVAVAWHTLALGIRAEQNGELAFSSDKADRLEVDWMGFVAGPSLGILARHLKVAREKGYVPYPEVLGEFLRDGEASARYAALEDWHRKRKHFWVGNGPFYLHSVHPVERTVVIRRYEDFPDLAKKWLRFSEPEIPVLDVDGPMVVETGDAAEFDLEITFAGEPYPPGAIEKAQYLLFDGVGELSRKGAAEPSGNGRWKIRLTPEEVAALGIGANSLEVAVSSQRVALPTFASHAFATVPR